ncbi:rod-binding protein [Desulfuromonas sp. KJ2020]|uniref:rod-binding protein n=1 Tax=Desulfuromonas sp. KJ2020 TaxID=2919173 RepID=UPI000323D8F2|nr:rod-binding protein [Desulfuromonas sp. KJ2020]MCP3178419.1 rod-binding protein [Desulfuromonas sp. KJ2020]
MKINVDPQILLSQANAQAPAKNVKRDDPEALKKTCQEFEAIFLASMFKAMRQSVPQGGIIEKGNADEIYQSLLDQEIATQAAKGQGMGIAEVLYRQLNREAE